MTSALGEVFQRRVAQLVGQAAIVDGTGQHEGADGGRDGDERLLVRGRLSPIGKVGF